MITADMIDKTFVKTKTFHGNSDPTITASVAILDNGDCTTAHVKLDFVSGFAKLTIGEIYPARKLIDNHDGKTSLIISIRDRGDSERHMLIKALRWAANEIEYFA